MNRARSYHAHVEIGEAHGNEAAPGEKHVALVQECREAPGSEAGAAKGRAREAIQFAAGKMTERVAGKCVERQERDVESENKCADADAKTAVEEEGADGVVPKENDEKNSKIEKIPMDVLQDERKRSFPAIIAPRKFANRASGRIQENRPVISFAVVVASGAKAEGTGEDQERW